MIPTTFFPSLKALGHNYGKCDLVDNDFSFLFFMDSHNEPFYQSSGLSVNRHSSDLVFAYS